MFDTLTGEVLQNYLPFGDSSGSYGGIAYSADGKYPDVQPGQQQHRDRQRVAHRLLTDYAHVSVPPNNSFIKCFPNSPLGDYGALLRHVLFDQHVLSGRRRLLAGRQERLCAC